MGEDISETLTYNGEELWPYETKEMNVTPNSTFTLTITENDSIPDSNSVNIDVGELSMDEFVNGYTIDGTMTVNERGGRRYPDAYAVFDYSVNLDPSIDEAAFKEYAEQQVQESDYWKSKNAKYDIY